MRFFAAIVLVAGLAGAQIQPKPGGRDLVPMPLDSTPKAEKPAPQIPRSYALVVGISAYKNLSPKENLRYAERDAESLFSILISPEGGNFHAENVKLLTGSKATLANLKLALEQWLPSVTKDDDRVLIYFAGHGFVDGQGKGFIAPYDLRKDNLQATAYPMETLGSVFGSRIRGKWKVLLTDACHSGAITPDASAVINRGLIDLNRSVFVLSASRDRELSYESPDFGGGHGIFTYYLERGLGGSADENGDGIVTADELSEYVRVNVRRDSKNQQNPNSERGSFDPQMLLAYVPSSIKPDAPPPPKFGVMIIESNMDGVEVFVDGKSEGVVNKGTPLRLQGLVPGAHTVKGVKMNYEPDGPREETIYPGQDTPVTITIRFQRKRGKAAVEQFDKGIEFYKKGDEPNYRKAVASLKKALDSEAAYSEAALYLGRTYNALNDQEKAETYFRRAIEIDPDYIEARASFGGMLLDKGATDEAIRQLNAALQRNKNYGEAWYLIAEAYRLKSAYAQSIEAARTAIRIIPNNAEAHLWLAESLRMSQQLKEAGPEYHEYLRLSNFDSNLAGKLNYWVGGFLIGRGKKSRASVHDIWRILRSLAYFGLCDCERQLKHYDAALAYCAKSVTYDADDPLLHYALGQTYAAKAQATDSLEPLIAASKHFRLMLQINSEMPEAPAVRQMLAQYDQLLRRN